MITQQSGYSSGILSLGSCWDPGRIIVFIHAELLYFLRHCSKSSHVCDNLLTYYHDSPFTDEETEAQRCCLLCGHWDTKCRWKAELLSSVTVHATRLLPASETQVVEMASGLYFPQLNRKQTLIHKIITETKRDYYSKVSLSVVFLEIVYCGWFDFQNIRE